MNLITVQPFDRINDKLIIHDAKLLYLLQSITKTFQYSNFEDSYDVQQADSLLHQRAFLHVVTETIYDYPHNSYGEKTFKPIVNFRPFILVSIPGALADLQCAGFKTFSQWWDEGYDQIQDPIDRMLCIVNLVTDIANKPLAVVKQMCHDMQEVLVHNHTHYYQTFQSQELKKFDQLCKLNLQPR